MACGQQSSSGTRGLDLKSLSAGAKEELDKEQVRKGGLPPLALVLIEAGVNRPS